MKPPWHDEATRLQQCGWSAAAIARRLKLRYMTVYLFCNPAQRDKINQYYKQRYHTDPAYRDYKRANRTKQYLRDKTKLDVSK